MSKERQGSPPQYSKMGKNSAIKNGYAYAHGCIWKAKSNVFLTCFLLCRTLQIPIEFFKIALFSDFRVLWALCISIRAFSCLLGSRIVGKRDKICFWMMFFNESLHIHRTGTYIYVGNEKCGPLGNIQSFVSQLIICLENRVKKLERLMEVGGFVIVGKYNTYT